MKRRFFYLIAVSLPMLVWSCVGKDPLPDLIPPPPTPGEQGGQGDQGGGSDTETHAWDANRGKEVYPSGTGWTSTDRKSVV